MQLEKVRSPYLLSGLAITSGCCSSEFAPMKRSYQVPIGLQQHTCRLKSPEAIGTTTVPQPQMLWRPQLSTFQTSMRKRGHPLMFWATQWTLKGCSMGALPQWASASNDQNLVLPERSFQSSPWAMVALTQKEEGSGLARSATVLMRPQTWSSGLLKVDI